MLAKTAGSFGSVISGEAGMPQSFQIRLDILLDKCNLSRHLRDENCRFKTKRKINARKMFMAH